MAYDTIKQIVFEMIHNTHGIVNYDELKTKILEYFPNSAFKRSHWNWYKSQCVIGKFSKEFSKAEKDNLAKKIILKNRNVSPNTIIPTPSSTPSPSNKKYAIEIDNNVFEIVNSVISSALNYEKVIGNNRKIGITGEVGEVLACFHLGLKLCIDPRESGYDAIDKDGKKVQIKTRRSESEGLPNDMGRIGIFSKHPFDYALLVLLDRNYQVAEIWKAEYKDVSPLIEKQKRRNPNLSSFKKLSRRIWRNYKKL